MKKIHSITLAAIVAFDYLCYKQEPGINVLLFNIILIGLCIIARPDLKHNLKWLAVAITSIITSSCVLFYGDMLSVATNLISLAILSAILTVGEASVFTALVGAPLAYIRSPYLIILNTHQAYKKNQFNKNDERRLKFYIICISIAVAILFFFIYQNSSLIFYHYTQDISFKFISWYWILFTINGLLLLVAFYNYFPIKWLHKIIDKPAAILSDNPIVEADNFGRFSPSIENFAGKLILSTLNILLLAVNCSDLSYLISGKLPNGVTYSEYVHYGVGMLVFSIVLAILIILYFFRGNLNFYNKNRWLKYLAYIWIVQNIFMIISNVLRNNMYVDAYGLTEKRIGVYFYLLLAFIGLFTTLMKIYKRYSNAYLFRMNSWIFYSIMVLSCAVNWDVIITRYDLSRKDGFENFSYLAELSKSNIPELFNYTMKEFGKNDSNRLAINTNSSKMNVKILSFLQNKRQFPDWKSWNIMDYKIQKNVIRFPIKSMYFENASLKRIGALSALPQLEELNLNDCYFGAIGEWRSLQQIKRLEVHNHKLKNISFVGQLKNLEYLNISKNQVEGYEPLYGLKKLKSLKIGSINEQQLKLLKTMLPNVTIIMSQN